MTSRVAGPVLLGWALTVAACGPPAMSPSARSSAPVPAASPQIPSQPPAPAIAASAIMPSPQASAELPPPPPPPPEPAAPSLRIELETPYKLEQRRAPTTREEYKVDLLDRIDWNKGGLGELAGEQPGPEGHPDPRVTVNIKKVNGGHQAKSLQRTARRYHWMKVVRCYRLGAYKDPHLRGWTHARMEVRRSGTVKSARLLSTELADRDVARCMVDKLKALKLPTSRSGSSVWVDMRVGPGDEPMPPPQDLIIPEDGTLTLEEMRAGVTAGLPALEACYRQGREYAPGLWGRLLIRFKVSKRGKLEEAFETESRFPDPWVKQCVLHAARKLKFARPSGGAIRFVVPLRLSSSESEHAESTAVIGATE